LVKSDDVEVVEVVVGAVDEEVVVVELVVGWVVVDEEEVVVVVELVVGWVVVVLVVLVVLDVLLSPPPPARAITAMIRPRTSAATRPIATFCPVLMPWGSSYRGSRPPRGGRPPP
jgi:Mn2+/Fe2+ NRAMP family transporter